MSFLWIVLILILFFAGVPVLANADRISLNGAIIFWAGKYLDPALVYGVVMTESSGRADAENPSDPSTGLMGVTPLIGRAYGGLAGSDELVLAQLKEPDANLRAGTGFLAHLQLRYANIYPVEEWVQAYNLGETKFDRGVRVPAYGESVLRFSREWSS
jgi:soluble lytic murein transglycosylase-like protein